MTEPKQNIVFFDFDGTITKNDTFIDFIIFNFGLTKYLFGLVFLSPVLLLYKIKIISNQYAKQKFSSLYFKNMSIKKYKNMVDKYIDERVPSILKKEAIEKLNEHKYKNDYIVIVSASFNLLINRFAQKYNFDKSISTILEVKNNKITGQFVGDNCYGMEKVNRIKKEIALRNFNLIYAYGDSKGDIPMLKIANHPFLNYTEYSQK